MVENLTETLSLPKPYLNRNPILTEILSYPKPYPTAEGGAHNVLLHGRSPIRNPILTETLS